MLGGYSEDELRPLVEVIGGMQDEIDMMIAEGRPSSCFVDKTFYLRLTALFHFQDPFTTQSRMEICFQNMANMLN